jgi:hypothetical protein
MCRRCNTGEHVRCRFAAAALSGKGRAERQSEGRAQQTGEHVRCRFERPTEADRPTDTAMCSGWQAQSAAAGRPDDALSGAAAKTDSDRRYSARPDASRRRPFRGGAARAGPRSVAKDHRHIGSRGAGFRTSCAKPIGLHRCRLDLAKWRGLQCRGETGPRPQRPSDWRSFHRPRKRSQKSHPVWRQSGAILWPVWRRFGWFRIASAAPRWLWNGQACPKNRRNLAFSGGVCGAGAIRPANSGFSGFGGFCGGIIRRYQIDNSKLNRTIEAICVL